MRGWHCARDPRRRRHPLAIGRAARRTERSALVESVLRKSRASAGLDLLELAVQVLARPDLANAADLWLLRCLSRQDLVELSSLPPFYMDSHITSRAAECLNPS
jgi:hypothetical protein